MRLTGHVGLPFDPGPLGWQASSAAAFRRFLPELAKTLLCQRFVFGCGPHLPLRSAMSCLLKRGVFAHWV